MKYFCGRNIKEGEIIGRGKRYTEQKLLFGHTKETGHLEDRCLDGRIMLKYILNKYALKLRTGLF
jgi:hypothetical protein